MIKLKNPKLKLLDNDIYYVKEKQKEYIAMDVSCYKGLKFFGLNDGVARNSKGIDYTLYLYDLCERNKLFIVAYLYKEISEVLSRYFQVRLDTIENLAYINVENEIPGLLGRIPTNYYYRNGQRVQLNDTLLIPENEMQKGIIYVASGGIDKYLYCGKLMEYGIEKLGYIYIKVDNIGGTKNLLLNHEYVFECILSRLVEKPYELVYITKRPKQIIYPIDSFIYDYYRLVASMRKDILV